MFNNKTRRNAQSSDKTPRIGGGTTVTSIKLLTSSHGSKETNGLEICIGLQAIELVHKVIGMAPSKYSRNVLPNWGKTCQILWCNGPHVRVSSMRNSPRKPLPHRFYHPLWAFRVAAGSNGLERGPIIFPTNDGRSCFNRTTLYLMWSVSRWYTCVWEGWKWIFVKPYISIRTLSQI